MTYGIKKMYYMSAGLCTKFTFSIRDRNIGFVLAQKSNIVTSQGQTKPENVIKLIIVAMLLENPKQSIYFV